MTYESICRFVIDGGIVDETGLTEALQKTGWDYETMVTARGHFARYQLKRAEADRIAECANQFVANFDTETAGTFEDERARRKSFATCVFGNVEAKTIAPYLFYTYDGKAGQLDAVLLRKVVLQG